MGYNIFRKLFVRDEIKTEDEESEKDVVEDELEDDDVLVSISMSYNPDMDIDISCIWKEDSSEASFLLADLLHKIDSGIAATYITNILIKHVSNQPNESEFVAKVFSMYETIKKNSEEERPLVRPSDVFRS